MVGAVVRSVSAWGRALQGLPVVRDGRWAVGGSASLALRGLPIDPRDIDLLADDMAVAQLVDGLQGAIVNDETPWDRGDVRALRRVLAVVHGVEVEILVGVEAIGPSGDVVVATPNLDHVDRVVLNGRRVPVLPLSTMRVLLEATGSWERAAMVREAIGRGDARGRELGTRGGRSDGRRE